MTLHIGTRIINAKPMTRTAYCALRGWALPDNENGDDNGYLIEHIDDGQANHPAYKGYITWSAADVFERSYHLYKGMDFGSALDALKIGLKVARSGWNGKGMWLYLVSDCEYILGDCVLAPLIVLKTPGNELNAWNASQADALAEDWCIVD